jgi:hypothetical protein
VVESFRHGREHFILQYQGHLFSQIRTVYLKRNYNAVEDFWKQLDFIGNKIFNLEMLSAADSYLRLLHAFIKLELVTIKRFRLAPPKDPLGLRQHSLDNIIEDGLVHDFQSNRIKSLTNFGTLAADKRMEYSVRIISGILDDIILAILKMNDRVIRKYTLYIIMESVKVIHQRTIDNNLRSSMLRIGHLKDYAKAIDIRYVNELNGLITSFCRLSIYSLKHGHYFEIDRLGIDGMQLVNDFPNLALIVLNTLEQCFEVVMKIEDKEVQRQQIDNLIDNVNYIGEHNKRQNKEIGKKIGEILMKYGIHENSNTAKA